MEKPVERHICWFQMAENLKPTLDLPKVLAVSQEKKSGLILCKAFHAEFAGPGAAVNSLSDQGCTAIFAIGLPDLIQVVTSEERQQAYRRRIQWTRWLQKIVDHSEAAQRAEKLFAGFEAFFGNEVPKNLPNEVIALMTGVLPDTVAIVRSQHQQWQSTVDEDAPPTKPPTSILMLDPHTFQPLEPEAKLFSLTFNLNHTADQLPCIA